MTREEILDQIAELKAEKLEIQTLHTSRFEKKRYKPRLTAIHEEIQLLEFDLAKIREQAKIESVTTAPAKKKIKFEVGDTLPNGKFIQTECPACGSAGEVCMNPYCGRYCGQDSEK